MAATPKEDERRFILECIEVYHSLPALWNVKSKDYINRMKKNEYEHLLRKYRERFPDADKNQLIKKFNCLHTNFRKELKRIKDSEKSGTIRLQLNYCAKILHRLGTPSNIIVQ
jgi:hypothetical protein